jgi:hypothetical protein
VAEPIALSGDARGGHRRRPPCSTRAEDESGGASETDDASTTAAHLLCDVIVALSASISAVRGYSTSGLCVAGDEAVAARASSLLGSAVIFAGVDGDDDAGGDSDSGSDDDGVACTSARGGGAPAALSRAAAAVAVAPPLLHALDVALARCSCSGAPLRAAACVAAVRALEASERAAYEAAAFDDATAHGASRS